MLLAKRAVVGRYTLAVVGVGTLFKLIHQIPDSQSVVLRGAKDDGLLLLIDFIQHNLNALFLAGFYFDDAVKIGFYINPAFFHFAFDNRIIRRVHIFINGCLNALHSERRQETVIDAVF